MSMNNMKFDFVESPIEKQSEEFCELKKILCKTTVEMLDADKTYIRSLLEKYLEIDCYDEAFDRDVCYLLMQVFDLGIEGVASVDKVRGERFAKKVIEDLIYEFDSNQERLREMLYLYSALEVHVSTYKGALLHNAINIGWNGTGYFFGGAKRIEGTERITIGEDQSRCDNPGASGTYIYFLAGNRDYWGGWIWIEYDPLNDTVGIYIKDRQVLPQYRDDVKQLFDKHSPFNLKLEFDENNVPLMSRVEKVAIENLASFFADFKKAYDEHSALFYMVSIIAKDCYDGFAVCRGYW